MNQVEALFQIAADVPHPKIKGLMSGYSPHHKFKSVDYLVSGRHSYDDSDAHFPGEIIAVRIVFVSWEYIKDSIKLGNEFEVLELDRLIGRGKITFLPTSP